MSKIDQAVAIVTEDPSASRKDLIARFVNELGMTPAGASTYVANARKKVNGVTVKVATKVSKRVAKSTSKKATKKVAARTKGVKQIIDDNQKSFEKEIKETREFKAAKAEFELKRPTTLAPHIVDTIKKMPASEKKARIAKMVGLVALLED